ncbi:nuclear transport factor 2 family protein [Exilibacterium tricleocarpae]|uniref:Nuclear transport factor 2 family protein n=1 Tax=Exilibacterium tricleocarpae TaxID=2591008 RepID=A0A545TVJ7_9GAMM|nr:nuclear transport factor 2 family protein [Exilibacterium tricleocarpae]TQV81181.1 nuclear transport factor 2 family protein [Exilibacterium tricleocarpae]
MSDHQDNYQDHKALVLDYYRALEDATAETVGAVLAQYTSDDYQWFGVHPFHEQRGSEAVAEVFWKPFYRAWSDVQRRQDIFMAGTSEIDGAQWVTSMGHLMGLLDQPWLGIPATRRLALLRYADFNCIRNGRICRTGFFCDLIGVMQQAGVNPLPPQTGAAFVCPGPRTQDGLLYEQQDAGASAQTLALVNRMIGDLSELNLSGDDRCPPEYLARTWHKDMCWYGPAGIGATYTIPRYQAQHQYPFRQGLTGKTYNGHVCRFAEGNYAGFFGWPNLTNTASGGFLGLPGNDVQADMRVVDIYRRQGDKLAENWVLIDLPYWLQQQGLDILARMRALAGT